jgi:CRISPR-associated protein Cas5d
LGWKEFTPDYVGVFRPETRVCSDINIALPSMLRQVFPNGLYSDVRYVFDQGVEIQGGVLDYPEVDYAQ